MRESQKYIPIIGLEIHVELKTNSKMFCGCRNDPFHAPKPNIYTCPVCLGLPGALPVPNKKALEWTVQLGLALGCTINKESKFDRKHYFYPDLPKGYQISQYDRPFCVNGKLSIAGPAARHPAPTSSFEDSSAGARAGARLASPAIRIRRVHLEEDTAKMLHTNISSTSVSLIDFNRSGVPLVEIVTEPDIRSAGEAKEFAKKIHQIVRSLGISDADMEKGSMRLEANVSLSETLRLPNYKVELKNINSFRFLEKAINSELERQEQLLSQGKVVGQETRGWDSKTQTTKAQRTKEEAADYRYFPEPDIPPIRLTDSQISEIRDRISEMPEDLVKKLLHFGVPEHIATLYMENLSLMNKLILVIDYYQKNSGQEIQRFSNWLSHRALDLMKLDPKELKSVYEEEKSLQISDSTQLEAWTQQVIEINPKAISDYRNGKLESLGFLIGQVQKLAKGKADVLIVKKLLLGKLR